MSRTKIEVKLHNSGLKPLVKDKRDFNLQRTFGSIASAPNYDFSIGDPLSLKQQFDSDFCAAFGIAAASEYQEGVELSPEFQFALIKKITGDPEAWGADLRTACKSAVKYGSLEKTLAPYTLVNKDRNFLANLDNWLELKDDKLEEARKHAKKSFFSVSEGVDIFHNIRTALWQNIAQKRAIITGMVWRYSWFNNTGLISAKYEEEGTPHAFIFTGQKIINGEPHLVAQLSSGRQTGDNGFFYFPKEVVNKEATFGNFMFVDMPPEIAKFLNDWKLSIKWNWLAKIVVYIKNLFK